MNIYQDPIFNISGEDNTSNRIVIHVVKSQIWLQALALNFLSKSEKISSENQKTNVEKNKEQKKKSLKTI